MDFECDTAAIKNELDSDLCCALRLSPPAELVIKLRAMMDEVEGEDKCTLCKAAGEIDKVAHNQSTSWRFPWLSLIMLLMCDGFGGKGDDMKALNTYMDVIKKKAQESDCKLQNES